MSFIRTGLREIGLKVRRQRTRMALRHQKRLLQKSEINLGREGTSQAANFPELRNEIVALKKLEQEQKEVAVRIAQIEEGIKKIEADRERNAQAQSESITRLENEKKPILQRRNNAKGSAETCERELAAIERRIQANDATDRDLLKQLAELEATVPPPADRETRAAAIGAQRARLPEERAELVRARLGSADAARAAKERLAAAEAELATMEKNVERLRADFENRDRGLTDNLKTQQEAIREARAHHQTVEERKNPAYLNIGRHLAAQEIAPPNAPELLTEVRRHHAAVDRHLQHTQELALLSSQVDKQELRKFYFSGFSVLVLLAIILILVFKSPGRQEWLPQETEAVLAINVEQLDQDELPKRWRKNQPDVWSGVWAGLTAGATRTPILNLARDAVRVTRAITETDQNKVREFILVQTHSDVSPIIRAIAEDKNFERHTIAGLAVWEKPDLAVARVGPATLAVGAIAEVDELVQVRLGLQDDLQMTERLSKWMQTLDQESSLRLLSRDPPNLPRLFHPVFSPELLQSAQLLGFTLSLQDPARARLLITTQSSKEAAELARNLQKQPQRWLRLADSDLLLFAQPPDITRQDASIEIRFILPDESARLLLQRLAKTDNQQVVATGAKSAQ
jgi:hypothetical protein